MLLQTLYPIPSNVPRIDNATNVFTGANRFTRVIAGAATTDDAAYNLVSGSTLIRGNLLAQGNTTLNAARVSGPLTLSDPNSVIFTGFGTSQGQINLFGFLGVDAGDNMLTVDRVGLSNYRWSFSGTQMTLNGNVVYHAGNLNVSSLATNTYVDSTFVKQSGTTNLATGVWKIQMTTAGSADTGQIQLQSGGSYTYTRGAILELNGKNATGSNAGGFRLLSDGASSINSYSGALGIGNSNVSLSFNSTLSINGTATVTGALTVNGALVTNSNLTLGSASTENQIRFALTPSYLYQSANSFGLYWSGSGGINLFKIVNPGVNDDPGGYPASSMVVPGKFYSQSDIRAQGSLISLHPDALRMQQSARTMIHRFDGSAYYWLRTAANDPAGAWDAARPMTYDVGADRITFNPAGGVTVQAKMTLSASAPIGLTGFGAAGSIYIHGTNGGGDDVCSILRNNANSNYTMTWNGAITVTGSQTTAGEHYCNNWFRSNTSGTGWYHQVHGGGIYMQDNDYLRSYQQKPIAASDFAIWSDRRSKTDDRDLTIAEVLPRFMQLAPKWYIKNGHRAEYGMFAQDVRALFPDMVSITKNEDWDDYHFLWANMFHAPHILVTQDNVRRIEELERVVAEQAETIATLTARSKAGDH